MEISFSLRVFARNLFRGNRRRNTFRILFQCLAWGSNPSFTSNKPTDYPLDYGPIRYHLFTLFYEIFSEYAMKQLATGSYIHWKIIFSIEIHFWKKECAKKLATDSYIHCKIIFSNEIHFWKKEPTINKISTIGAMLIHMKWEPSFFGLNWMSLTANTSGFNHIILRPYRSRHIVYSALAIWGHGHFMSLAVNTCGFNNIVLRP